MNEIIPNDRDRFNERLIQLRKMSDGELKEALAAAVRVTVDQLVEMSAIVRVLEERGHNLAEIRLGLLFYVRRIAYQQLMPELVVQFQGYPSILRRVASLAMPDQMRLLSNERLKVVVIPQDGQPTHRLCAPTLLSADQAKQVFANDHIRNEEEQVAYITRRCKSAGPKTNSKRFKVNDQRFGLDVVFGKERVFIGFDDLADAVARLEHVRSSRVGA